MTGRKSFRTLTQGFTPDQREQVDAAKAALRQQMSLAELRQARKLTRDALSQTLQVGQPAIAKLKNRTDMYVGNLRRFVEAMGGELEIVAHFPDGDVTINNFSELAA
jgi:hypothetical protein